MSTRCNIHFSYGARERDLAANIYRHSDGYPDGKHGVPADLARFFAAVEEATRDTRFDDPEYLAAKYLVWQAGECTRSGKALDFLGVSPCIEDHGDIEYVYTVNCGALDESGHPSVTWVEAGR